MGLLGRLLGGKNEELPALDASSLAARRIEKFRPQIESLVRKVNDRYEAVPADNALYVFLGKPPGMFGIVWFLEGDAEAHNLKKLIARKGLSQKKTDALMQKLRDAYGEAESEARYSATADSKKVVVLPSESLASKLHSILHAMDE